MRDWSARDKLVGLLLCAWTSKKFSTLHPKYAPDVTHPRGENFGVDVRKKHATDLQQSSITERRNVLRSRIRGWEALQKIYMPGLLQFHINNSRQPNNTERTSSPLSIHAEDAPLWFPSAVPPNSRRVVCVEGLPAIKDRLRTAQCHDALHAIHNTLRLKTHMVYFKNKNSWGQKEGLHLRSLIDRIQARIKTIANKYCAAHKAKLQLAGAGLWMNELCSSYTTKIFVRILTQIWRPIRKRKLVLCSARTRGKVRMWRWRLAVFQSAGLQVNPVRSHSDLANNARGGGVGGDDMTISQ